MRHSLPVWTALLLCFVASAQSTTDFKRTEDVIYGRKFGTALTMDIFQPARPNGSGIVFMVSGGFYSSHDAINAGFFRPFLNRATRYSPSCMVLSPSL